MEFLSLHNLIWVLPIIIAAISAAAWSYRQRKKAVALLTQNAQSCHLMTNASPVRRHLLATVLLASIILAGFAALRPSGGTTLTEYQRPAKNLTILLDVSNSMTAVDGVGISRFEAARLFLRALIESRPTDRIGMISFAGNTFIESPVTLDHSILLKRLGQAKPGAPFVPGTNITGALEEARALLTETPPPGSAILVFSDGDNVTGSDPKEILADLKKKNIPVLSVAFGQNGLEAIVPGSDLKTRANHDTLRQLSDATDGLFLAASPKDVDTQVAQLGTRIDTITLDGENIATELFERPYDLYAWFLSVALFCLMIHLFLPLRTKRWHPLTASLPLIFALPSELQAEQFNTYAEALEAARADERPVAVIFIGSDWSPLSISFEKEILSHPVFQKWAETSVAWTLVDLPRVGLSDEERRNRREFMAKLKVETFPMAVFLDDKENQLGTLTHDPEGPSSWTRRADAIIAGDTAAGDTAASASYLPEEVRQSLEDESLTDEQRSVRYYNKALEIEKAEPELTLESKDRFELLIDLYTRAAEAAPTPRKDLIFPARLRLAHLHHRMGLTQLPKSEQELGMMSMAKQTDPINLLKRAKKSFQSALRIYKNAAPLNPGSEELSNNLALAYQNVSRTQAYLDFFEAYQKAIETTSIALDQEKAFAASLRREVNTRLEINKEAIAESARAIQELIAKAEAIEDSPTILPAEGLKDYRLADEDIVLAPSPHRERNLEQAAEHIQDALDHLIDPQQMQPQQGEGESEDQGEGEGEEEGQDEGENEGGRQRDLQEDNPQGDRPEGEQPGGEEGEQPEPKGEGGEDPTENDLKRAEKEGGDLRQRLLRREQNEYFRRGRPVPRGKGH